RRPGHRLRVRALCVPGADERSRRVAQATPGGGVMKATTIALGPPPPSATLQSNDEASPEPSHEASHALELTDAASRGASRERESAGGASREAFREAVAGPARRKQLVYRAGSGPPLLWLHSLYGVEADAPTIEALAELYSVFAPLAPGFADLDDLDAIRDI